MGFKRRDGEVTEVGDKLGNKQVQAPDEAKENGNREEIDVKQRNPFSICFISVGTHRFFSILSTDCTRRLLFSYGI